MRYLGIIFMLFSLVGCFSKEGMIGHAEYDSNILFIGGYDASIDDYSFNHFRATRVSKPGIVSLEMNSCVVDLFSISSSNCMELQDLKDGTFLTRGGSTVDFSSPGFVSFQLRPGDKISLHYQGAKIDFPISRKSLEALIGMPVKFEEKKSYR